MQVHDATVISAAFPHAEFAEQAVQAVRGAGALLEALQAAPDTPATRGELVQLAGHFNDLTRALVALAIEVLEGRCSLV